MLDGIDDNTMMVMWQKTGLCARSFVVCGRVTTVMVVVAARRSVSSCSVPGSPSRNTSQARPPTTVARCYTVKLSLFKFWRCHF